VGTAEGRGGGRRGGLGKRLCDLLVVCEYIYGEAMRYDMMLRAKARCFGVDQPLAREYIR